MRGMTPNYGSVVAQSSRRDIVVQNTPHTFAPCKDLEQRLKADITKLPYCWNRLEAMDIIDPLGIC